MIDSKVLQFAEMLYRKPFFPFSLSCGLPHPAQKVVACPRLSPTFLSPTFSVLSPGERPPATIVENVPKVGFGKGQY